MDNLQWFKVGDVITDDNPKSKLHEKRITVKRVDLVGEEGKKTAILRGRIGSVDCAIDKPDNLILLERPGLGFKVGDEVEALDGKPLYYKGIVIIIDPTNDMLCFFVEFKGWRQGCSGATHWDEPWYPKAHKTESRSRWWCRQENLRSIK